MSVVVKLAIEIKELYVGSDVVNVSVVVKLAIEIKELYVGSDVVNVSVVVKLAIEIKELYVGSVRQGDGVASNTDGTDCPVPVPGEHDDLSFKCTYVSYFPISL